MLFIVSIIVAGLFRKCVYYGNMAHFSKTNTGPKEGLGDVVSAKHLKCPVCLDVYKSPRVLSCMHTFCEACIRSVVVIYCRQWVGKAFPGITCPVCKIVSPVTDPSKPVEELAGCLPLNYALVPMLDSLDVQKGSIILCEMCPSDEEKKTAKYFCTHCDQNQCEDCNKVHGKIPATRKHTVISIENMTQKEEPKVSLGNLEVCEVHEQKKIKFFCEDHQALCCSTCAIVNHRQCRQVAEVQGLGSRISRDHNQSQIKSLKTKLRNATQKSEDNIKSLETQLPSIQAVVRKQTEELINSLLGFQERACATADELKTLHSSTLKETLTKHKSLVAAMDASSKMFDNVLEHGTDAQKFIANHKLKEQIQGYRSMVEEESSGSKSISLQLKLTRELEALMKVSKEFGTVEAKVVTPFQGKSSGLNAQNVSRFVLGQKGPAVPQRFNHGFSSFSGSNPAWGNRVGGVKPKSVNQSIVFDGRGIGANWRQMEQGNSPYQDEIDDFY